MKNKVEEIPNGFVLLQEENGRACYVACMIGQFSGWLMWKHPDGQWISKRKLESWELMQVEDQRDDSIVFGADPVQAQEPVTREKTKNPFPEGSPNENWRRGYEGVRHFGAPDSEAARHWKMGQAARKADDRAPVQPVAVPDGCNCDDGLVWEAGCTSPCDKCQDVTDDSAAAPAAQGDSVTENFDTWWEREQKCPEHDLVTENAARAAWTAAIAAKAAS